MNIQYILLLPLIHTSAFSAVSVNFNNFDSNQGSITAGGITYTVTLDDTGDTLVHSFTATGDLDGLGTSDDTLSFDLVDTFYSGSTYDTLAQTLTLPGSLTNNDLELASSTGGTAGALHFGLNDSTANNGFLSAGDTFELSITNISYTRGEGFTNNVTFNGFGDAGVFTRGSGGNALLGTSGALTSVTTNGSTVNFGGAQAATFTLVSGTTGAASDELRVRDIDFSFDLDDSTVVIPEPSSTLLLAVAGLFIIRRRQR